MIISILLLISACTHSGFDIVSIDGQYIPVVQAANPDTVVLALLRKYKSILEEQNKQELGFAADELVPGRPESSLTNFTSDAMLRLDLKYTNDISPDFSLMNVGGIRAPIRQGPITAFDLYNTYSFDNELVILQLKGKDVKSIFESYARMGGAGISSTVRLRIKDKEIREALIHGKPVVDDKIYTIVTLDFLAEGNDGMQALTKAVSVHPTGIKLRDYMTRYICRLTSEGKKITAFTDQRIVIE